MPDHDDFWMPFLIGKYLANTMHLDTTQHGAYFLLLIHYWKNRGPLPDDDAYLASVAKRSLSDWLAMRSVIGKFFRIKDGKWIQDRAEKELKRFFTLQDAKRQGAAKTNAKRWKKSQDCEKSQSESLSDTQSESLSTTTSEYTPTPTPTVLSLLPLSQESEPVIPTLEEVERAGAMLCITKEVCGAFYRHYQGNNLWLNQHGRPIHIPTKLQTWANNDRASKTNGSGNVNGALPRWRQVENLRQQIEKHPANMSSVYRNPNVTDEQKYDLVKKKEQLKILEST